MVVLGVLLVARASSHVNKIALAGAPRGVTVVEARPAQYRALRRYVGTIQPWIEAQGRAAARSRRYVDTVLVRPGDVVKRGQVIATLDCRNASASSKAVSMQARALQAEQEAIAHEAARVAELQEGGFASPNEIERHAADSASKEAQVHGDRGAHAARDAGGERLRAARAVRGRDRGALRRPGRVRAPGHGGRHARSIGAPCA